MDNTGDPDLYIVLRPRYNAINTIITQLEKSYRWKLLFKLPLKGTTCLFDYCTIIESFRLCCIQAACVVRCKDKILNLNLSLFIFFFFFLRPNIYPNSFVWLLSKFHSSSNFLPWTSHYSFFFFFFFKTKYLSKFICLVTI